MYRRSFSGISCINATPSLRLLAWQGYCARDAVGAPIQRADSPGQVALVQVPRPQRDRIGTPAAAHPTESETDMKQPVKKLKVDKHTIRLLTTDDVAQAAGGWIRPPITWSCPQP
jgi:hypothetical protein